MTPLRSLFAALLLPLCATAAHAQEWKEIRFGVFPEYPPFESVAADGSLQGFDIELGNAICAKLDVKCTWVHNEFDGMIPALRARKFDAIMSSMAVTPAREKIIDFTDRLFLSPTSVITRTDKLEAQLNFLSKPEGADFKTGPAFKDPTLPLDIAMGLRKNDQELRALINKGIAAVQADGTYAEIQKKYFGDQDIYNE